MKKITDTGMLRVTSALATRFRACATEVIIRDGAGELTITLGTPPYPGDRSRWDPAAQRRNPRCHRRGHGTLAVAGNEVRCVVSGAEFAQRVTPKPAERVPF